MWILTGWIVCSVWKERMSFSTANYVKSLLVIILDLLQDNGQPWANEVCRRSKQSVEAGVAFAGWQWQAPSLEVSWSGEQVAKQSFLGDVHNTNARLSVPLCTCTLPNLSLVPHLTLHLFFSQPICLHRNIELATDVRGGDDRSGFTAMILGMINIRLARAVVMVVGMGEVGGQLFNRCSHSRFLFHILTKTQNLNPATNLGLK